MLLQITALVDIFSAFAIKPKIAVAFTKQISVLEKNKYKPKLSLSLSIKNVLFPIYLDLLSDYLLEKCLNGQKQNTIKTINVLIREKCPKHKFVVKSSLQTGTRSAVLELNGG